VTSKIGTVGTEELCERVERGGEGKRRGRKIRKDKIWDQRTKESNAHSHNNSPTTKLISS
jgi:hypothetical protein